MPTTLAVRFPLGRYHATPWDRSVNEAAVEWPPSPWRLLRALIATWYTRWPDLPAVDLDALLAALGDPPAYLAPPVCDGHTRHYLPDANHTTAETGNTDLTFDPYLSIPRDAELLIQWPVDLSPATRSALAKLAEQLPYLGRADAVCHARLLDTTPTVDTTWWRPVPPDAASEYRLLAARTPIQRTTLEATTDQVRRARRTLPAGATWVEYQAPTHVPATPAAKDPAAERAIEAIRFHVHSTAPFHSRNGVLLADAVHHWMARRAKLDPQWVLGRAGAATDHQHAHLIPLADHTHTIRSLIIWVPVGLTSGEAVETIALSGENEQLQRSVYPGGEPVRGFPKTRLMLTAAGAVRDVAPELCGPATTWHTTTPYLPVRHRKQETIAEFFTADLAQELHYRGKDTPNAVTLHDNTDRLTDQWAVGFRRYRLRQKLGQAHPGRAITLHFAKPIHGPLLLGRLAHFGLGIFTPDPAT